MSVRLMRGAARAAVLLLAAVVTVPQAGANDVAGFYQGRNVTILIGFAPGGGADTFGRLLARHLGKHIPGSPNSIVQNMPGAGGFTALNHVYNLAPKDGTYIGLVSSAHATAPSLGNKNARWDMFKFQWLGNLSRDASACVASGRSGIRSIAEARERSMIFGATGKNSVTAQQPRLLANLLDYKIRVIPGYPGISVTKVAMEQGEVDATCAFWASMALGSMKQDLASGALVPIVQVGARKHPAFGAAPLVYDLARTEDERKVMRFIFGPTEISRAFTVAPGVPADRVAALREAFWAVAASPDFRADAKRGGFIIDPMTWQETEAAYREALDVPPAIIERVKKAIGG